MRSTTAGGWGVRNGSVVALCATAVVLAWGAARADAFVYWANQGPGPTGVTIARAELDGSNPDVQFIKSGVPIRLVVDDAHIYWTNSPRSIGRANLDGTNADPNFILTPGRPGDIAVDSGHIYWTNTVSLTSRGSIARANLDGSGVEQSFIPLIDGPNAVGLQAIAVDAGQIYWTESGYPSDQIVRANLDGTNRQTLVTIPGNYGRVGLLAVDGAHVYWTSPGDGLIARANLDGSSPELRFMTGVGQGQLVVDAAHIYYGGRRKLGRANLDGSGRNDTFIKGYNVLGVAVDALHGPSGVPARSARIAADGVVRLPRPWVTCPPAAPACVVTVKAKAALTRRSATASIGQTRFSVAAGTTVSARFTLSGSGRKALNKVRRLKTTITITTRHGAQATTRTVRLTLKAPPR